MNNKKAPTILITGAGGPAIPTIIENLRKKFPGIRVIAGDMSKFAVGFHFSDLGVVLPPGNDENFLACVKEIVTKENISIIISVVDEELSKLGTLESDVLKVIQPNNNFIDLCLNKITLFDQLKSLNIIVPNTIFASDRKKIEILFPVILKPIVGRGSRGIAIAWNQDDLEKKLAKSEYKEQDLLIQRYIQGDEYTVSVVAWRDNVIRAIVPKLVLVKQGVTKLAKTERNKVVMEYCEVLHKALQPHGPYNVQLVLEKETGQPYLFEINPRYSTTATLTIASGVDEVGGIIELIEHGSINFNNGNFIENLYMARRTQDIYMTEFEYDQANIFHG
jgi:carbamoyl-phosphate synthase large subunit